MVGLAIGESIPGLQRCRLVLYLRLWHHEHCSQILISGLGVNPWKVKGDENHVPCVPACLILILSPLCFPCIFVPAL